MTKETINKEIRTALAKLDQEGIKERQHAVALCAEEIELFDTKFFAGILLRESDPICKWYAIRALGDLRANQYAELLVDVLRQPDIEVGKSSLHLICARSIGLLGSQMVPHIVELLDEPNEATRLAAADTLGEIGHHSAIPALSCCLTSGERNLQLWASLSLGKIGTESIPEFIKALSSATKEDALIFLDALLIIGTPSIIDAVIEIMNKYPDVVQFYLTGTQPERVKYFLDMLQDIISSGGPCKDSAEKILSFLKLKTSSISRDDISHLSE